MSHKLCEKHCLPLATNKGATARCRTAKPSGLRSYWFLALGKVLLPALSLLPPFVKSFAVPELTCYWP